MYKDWWIPDDIVVPKAPTVKTPKTTTKKVTFLLKKKSESTLQEMMDGVFFCCSSYYVLGTNLHSLYIIHKFIYYNTQCTT